MPHLLFAQSDRILLTHLLRPGRTVIGRSDRCDVALPGDRISRTHCTVEQRPEGWTLVDRSTHGTTMGGKPVERHVLDDGDVFVVGDYRVTFQAKVDPRLEPPTETSRQPQALHEELVEIGPNGVATSRVALRFARGPRQGERVVLDRPRTAVGGHGAHVVLNRDLPKEAFFVRVVRGRALVEPGGAPVFLAGGRVRQITPALFGEEIRCGDDGLVVESETAEENVEDTAFGAMVGRSGPMRRLFGILGRIAAHEAPALLTGESGTGKELAAKGLHDASPRADGPFVAVNCAGIPQNLFESELFGHVKGAFTGATDRQDGAFQRASGGTLFLDEIGELPLDAQAKLLRALESGEVRRVGGAQVEYPDVRVVAATNRDLLAMVKKGTFREDLYYRLAVLTVHLPPLRDRPEDVRVIAKRLMERHHPDGELTERAFKALEGYEWPGNIRELRNVLTRAYVLSGPVIDGNDLSFTPGVFERAPVPRAPRSDDDERAAILEALASHADNRTLAAQALGIPRSSLLYKMKRLGLMP